MLRPLWESDQWSALIDWSRNAHLLPTGQSVQCAFFEKQGGREVESSNLSEPTALAHRKWVRQASLFVGCHRPERCALIMIDHGGNDWNFCPSGCGGPATVVLGHLSPQCSGKAREHWVSQPWA